MPKKKAQPKVDEKDYTYHQILRLMDKLNYDHEELWNRSIETLETWRRTLSLQPYDIRHGEQYAEFLASSKAINATIKSKNEAMFWDPNYKPENLKAKMDSICHNLDGVKKNARMRKSDIDRFHDAAKEMLFNSLKEVNGKIMFKRIRKKPDFTELVKLEVKVAGIRMKTVGTKLFNSKIWTNPTKDAAKKTMLKARFEMEDITEEIKACDNKARIKNLRHKMKKYKVQHEAMMALLGLIDNINDQKRIHEYA